MLSRRPRARRKLAGMFGDARVRGDDWERLPASSPADRKALIARLDAALAG